MTKRIIALSLAAVLGLGAAATALAQTGDQLVTLCFRSRTIQVPFYLQQRYTSAGATVGPCTVTPP